MKHAVEKFMDFCPNFDEEHEKQSKLFNISAVEQEPFGCCLFDLRCDVIVL